MMELPDHDDEAAWKEEGSSPFGLRPPVARWVLWAICATLITAFLGLDFLAQLALGERPNVMVLALAGLCIGQVNLIATWAVLAPGSLVVRLPWTLLLGMLTWFALVLGGRIARGMVPQDQVLLGTVLLSGCVFLQIPLWIAKKAFGWRMVREGEARDTVREDRQFNLRQMLLGTLLLALALAPVRFLVPPGIALAIEEGLREVSVILGVALLCNLVVTVPCIWGGLILSAEGIVPAALGWLGYCLLLTLVEIVLLSPFLVFTSDLFEVCGGFYLLNVTQCLAVFGTLRLFRHLGFRLVRLPSAPPRLRASA